MVRATGLRKRDLEMSQLQSYRGRCPSQVVLLNLLLLVAAGCARLGLAPLEGACDGVECDGHGTCEVDEAGEAVCLCEESYQNVGPLHCRASRA